MKNEKGFESKESKRFELKVLDYHDEGRKYPKDGVLAVTGHMMDEGKRKTGETPARFRDTMETLVRVKEEAFRALDRMNAEQPIKVILMGGTHGFDRIVLDWALRNGVSVEEFRPYAEQEKGQGGFYDKSVTLGGETTKYWEDIWHREHTPNSGAIINEPSIIDSPTDSTPLRTEVENASKYNPYQCYEDVNFKMLNVLSDANPGQARVLALWDGKGGDTPGGTQHFLTASVGHGAKSYVLNEGIENRAGSYPKEVEIIGS